MRYSPMPVCLISISSLEEFQINEKLLALADVSENADTINVRVLYF